MNEWPRTILHADMDAFYAAVEQRDHPEWRGKPVIVGGTSKRGVVATASYEARAFGVHSAQPGAIARRLCPDGVFVTPRMDVYVAVSQRIQAIFADFTPEVEALSLDEAFLDVSASRLVFGDGPAIAQRIRERVRAETGLTISIGVASSKFVAKVASDLDKPDGLVVVAPGDERAFLRPLPVQRLWGAGKRTQALLGAHGIRTIGDVQDLGQASLRSIVGEHAASHFAQLAVGDDPRAVIPDREAKSISHETTFEDDVLDLEVARAVLLSLAESVGSRLRKHELRAMTVKLKLRWAPFETVSRQQSLEAATDDDLVLYRGAAALFDKCTRASDGTRGIRLLGIAATGLVPAAGGARQAMLFTEVDTARDAEKSTSLLRAMDAIRKRFGTDALGHGSAQLGDRHRHKGRP